MDGSLDLYLFTYNCALLPVSPESLSSVLLQGLAANSSFPDLIVLSLQEIAEPSIALLGGCLLDGTFQLFSATVQDATQREFGESARLVAKHNVGPTALMVFAKEPSRVQYVQHSGRGTSKWDVGIKGGVALNIAFSASNAEVLEFIFVGAHLTPHEILIGERNSDWEKLVRGLVFGNDGASSTKKPHGIYHGGSHLFVLGDLNYRTSSAPPHRSDYMIFPQPNDSSSRISLGELLRRDQLTAERIAGRAFHGLEEEPINFPPTFKFIIARNGAYQPELWNWAPHRWPSWCDRILYLPIDSAANSPSLLKRFKAHKYTSLEQIMDSDHKPVSLHVSVPAQKFRSSSADPRLNPPYPIDLKFQTLRHQARRREIALGLAAWMLVLTRRRNIAILLTLGALMLTLWWFFKWRWDSGHISQKLSY